MNKDVLTDVQTLRMFQALGSWELKKGRAGEKMRED